MKQYYEILRDLREDRDFTQAEIAAVLGTTQQVYSRYEKGINELPIRHLITLCRFYQVSSDMVLGICRNADVNEALKGSGGADGRV